MRRVTLMILFVIVVSACGVVEQPPSSAPAPQSAQTNAYPTPIGATPLPSPEPATATSVPPTVVTIPTVETQPLTVTKIQSFSVSNQALPVRDLLGWSPDDEYFLYSRVDRFDQASRFLLGELYTLNITTGEDMRIAKNNIILGLDSQNFTYSLGTGIWESQCCTILMSSLDKGKQSIQTVDLKTKKEKALKTTDAALFGYHGKQVGLVENGAFTLDDLPVSTKFLQPSSALTSTILTQHGLYTHNGRDIRYISDKNEIWEMNGDTTFLQDKPKYKILQMAVSPDETMVALVVGAKGSKSWNLWLLNRNTNTYDLLASSFLAYPSWSADGQYLMYRAYDTLTIIDLTTKSITPVIQHANIPVWHHTKPWFALLNHDARTIRPLA